MILWHLFGLVNLRTWLVIISVTEGMYLILLFLAYVKRKCFGNTFQQFHLNGLEEVYSMGVMFKTLACSVVETFYFFGVVMNSCQGSVYAYELTLTCIHIVLLTALGAMLLKNCFC